MSIRGQADILHVCAYTYTYYIYIYMDVYEHMLADNTYVADIYFVCIRK